MSEETKRLLFTEKPYPDESFIGYLLRLTELNYIDRLSWILQLSRLNIDFNSATYPRIKSKEGLKVLAELSGTSEKILDSLAYQIDSEIPNKRIQRYLLFGNSMPFYFIFHRHSRICPLCLSERSYLRRIWEFAPITVCLHHQCLLIDACPNCQDYLIWNRGYVSKCLCGFDCRKSEPVYVSKSELRIAANVYRLCKISSDKVVLDNYTQLENYLTELSFLSFFKLLFFFASNFAGLNEMSGKSLINTFSNEELHSYLNSAAMVIDDFPRNFFIFLDWLKHRNAQNITTESNTVEFSRIIEKNQKSIESFQGLLRNQLDFPQYNFIHSAFGEYLESSAKVYLNRLWQYENPKALAKAYAILLKRRNSSSSEDW